jgi:hypothetical protein
MLESHDHDHEFKFHSGQTQGQKKKIVVFHEGCAALRSNCKDCLAQNWDNVSEWIDMFNWPQDNCFSELAC